MTFAVTDRGGATIDPAITGFGGAHGGYVMTLALQAMREAVDADRAPRSLALHLLAPAAPGRVELPVRVERAGGSMTTVSARVEQAETTVALAVGAFGRARPSLVQQDTAMPDVPPPEACAPLVERPADVGVNHFVEHRPAAGPLPLTGTLSARGGQTPSETAGGLTPSELVAWMRLGEDQAVDALSATFLADALAPALYGALAEYVPMPSTEITLHYADPVADGPWVLARVRNRLARDGYAIEDGERWSPDGRLLLHSRQLRRVLVPTG